MVVKIRNERELYMKKRLTQIILFLLIGAIIIGITMTNAANNATEPETEQTFTEDGDGYYIWVRAVDSMCTMNGRMVMRQHFILMEVLFL